MKRANADKHEYQHKKATTKIVTESRTIGTCNLLRQGYATLHPRQRVRRF